MRSSALALVVACGGTPPPPPLHASAPPPEPEITCPAPVAPVELPLKAAALLDAEMVLHLPTHPTGLTAGVIDTPQDGYDDVHYQATGKPEPYDLALRVWTGAAACTTFITLRDTYPQAMRIPSLGDRAFLAKESYAYGTVIYERRGVLLLVLCGTEVCKSPEDALQLARSVHARVPR